MSALGRRPTSPRAFSAFADGGFSLAIVVPPDDQNTPQVARGILATPRPLEAAKAVLPMPEAASCSRQPLASSEVVVGIAEIERVPLSQAVISSGETNPGANSPLSGLS